MGPKIERDVSDQPAPQRVRVEVSLGIEGPGDEYPLKVITGITEGMKSLENSLRTYVALARGRRFTWEEIGEALGITRQSAWERFSVE